MKLYHYSTQSLEVLHPRAFDRSPRMIAAQTMMAESRRPSPGKAGPWPIGISFFHDRLPFLAIEKVFGNMNPHWPEGVTFYEYEVDTSVFEDFFFYVIDPPELVGFVPGTMGTGKSFPEFWFSTIREKGYLGTKKKELNSAIVELLSKGSMRDMVIGLMDRINLHDLAYQEHMGLPAIVVQSRPGEIKAFTKIAVSR